MAVGGGMRHRTGRGDRIRSPCAWCNLGRAGGYGGGRVAEEGRIPAPPAAAAWLDLGTSWVAAKPTAGHPAGLAEVREALLARLERLGFFVRVHANGDVAPVVVA